MVESGDSDGAGLVDMCTCMDSRYRSERAGEGIMGFVRSRGETKGWRTIGFESNNGHYQYGFVLEEQASEAH